MENSSFLDLTGICSDKDNWSKQQRQSAQAEIGTGFPRCNSNSYKMKVNMK